MKDKPHIAAENRLDGYRKLEQRAATAENERDFLRCDLARISTELGLPPTIGPAPGEIARLVTEVSRLRAELAAIEREDREGWCVHCACQSCYDAKRKADHW